MTEATGSARDTFSVEDVSTFVTIATRLATHFGMKAWYRGQSDAGWKLWPAVARFQRGPGHEPNRCIHFMRRAATRYDKCPSWNDQAGWLFLMQHYGLQTRLLDWTELPLVALFFAVEGTEDVDAAVHVLDAYRLNAANGFASGVLLPHHATAKKLIGAAFKTTDPTQETLAILPPEMDYRMLLQRAMFTIHGDRTPLEEHPSSANCLAKIIVPANRRNEIRTQLEVLGIDRAHLFPDLANLAAHLNTGTGGAP